MKKVIFKELLIADLNNKKAKKITFEPGLNLLTSKLNHMGKSLICKSLYYTLGAEVFFSDAWKPINSIYALKFRVDQKDYKITRYKTFFNIYDQKKKIYVKNVTKELTPILNDIFGMNIMLISRGDEKAYISCPPVFMYYPYYIDQENGWTKETISFERLAQFNKEQRKDALFFHLDCLNNNYATLKLQEEEHSKEILNSEKSRDNIINIISFVEKYMAGFEDATNEGELKNILNENRKKIDLLIKEMDKVRNEIIQTVNNKTNYENEKKIVSKYLDKTLKSPTSLKEVQCPKCETKFTVNFDEEFRKNLIVENVAEEYEELTNKIGSCDRKIEKLNKKYIELRAKLVSLENSLSNDKEAYNNYLKSKSSKLILKENKMKLADLDIVISAMKEELKAIRQSIKKYNDNKVKANNQYNAIIKNLFAQLEVDASQIKSFYGVGDEISVGGAYNSRAIICKYYAFLKTKALINKDKTDFPLVIDSPKGSEQDSENTKLIMNFIINNKLIDNQIIVSTIDGEQFANENINMIKLTNERNQLLNTKEYSDNEIEINKILLDF